MKTNRFWRRSWIILFLIYSISAWGSPSKGQDAQWPELETISAANINRLSLLNSFQITNCFVSEISLNAEATLLASSGSDTIQLWDIHTGELVRILMDGVCSDSLSQGVSFSPVDSLLAYFDGTNVVIEDIKTQTIHATLDNTLDPIGFNPDGQLLAATNRLSENCVFQSSITQELNSCSDVSIWKVETGAKHLEVRGHAAVERFIGTFSGNGNYLFFPHFSSILAWDVHTGELAGEFDGPSSATYSMAASDEWVYGGGAESGLAFHIEDSEITAIDPVFDDQISEATPYNYPFSVEGIGELMVVGAGHGNIVILDVLTGAILHTIQAYPQDEFIYTLEVSQDKKLLVVATRTGKLTVWGVPSE